MEVDLDLYKKEMEAELSDILTWWQQRTVDHVYGGFIGQIDYSDQTIAAAPKGAVLNARILWTFSSAYLLTNHPAYLKIAERSFEYIRDFFIDEEYGGVYWTVDYKGIPADTKKQIYAIAFALYGMSEYYRCTRDEKVKQMTIQLYEDIETHSYDSLHGGYFEAFSRDWSEMDDIRLSPKDANEKKSMNTHLHVLEAYSNLYKIWPDETLKKKIQELIQMFNEHIIHPTGEYLLLFFDEAWKESPAPLSFGHNIEAAWLLQEAAETLGNPFLAERSKMTGQRLVDGITTALDDEGGLVYEFDPASLRFNNEKHWWPQAESMVGYFNAWQNSGKNIYLERSWQAWNFVKNHLKDKENGEWFWGIKDNGEIMKEDKMGLWKCPYHNGRACMEIIRRVSTELGVRS